MGIDVPIKRVKRDFLSMFHPGRMIIHQTAKTRENGENERGLDTLQYYCYIALSITTCGPLCVGRRKIIGRGIFVIYKSSFLLSLLADKKVVCETTTKQSVSLLFLVCTGEYIIALKFCKPPASMRYMEKLCR